MAIGLGSNMPPEDVEPFSSSPGADPRARALEGALAALADVGLRILRTSALRETEPVDVRHPQGLFLNACALLETSRPLERLLADCAAIEARAGRRSKGDGSARPLDLDVLAAWMLDGGEAEPVRLDAPACRVPHPRLAGRAFVLRPLAEIAPEWPVPLPDGATMTVRALLERLEGGGCAPDAPGPPSTSFPRRVLPVDGAGVPGHPAPAPLSSRPIRT